MDYKTLNSLSDDEHSILQTGIFLLGMSGEVEEFTKPGTIEKVLAEAQKERREFMFRKKTDSPGTFFQFLSFPSDNFQLQFIPDMDHNHTNHYKKAVEQEGEILLPVVKKIGEYDENFLDLDQRRAIALKFKKHDDLNVPEQARLLYEAYLILRKYNDGLEVELFK